MATLALSKNDWYGAEGQRVKVVGLTPAFSGWAKSRWEGFTDDGLEVRIAYSWGQLVFGIGMPTVETGDQLPDGRKVGLIGAAVCDDLGAQENAPLDTVRKVIESAGWPVELP